jgi:hypothetical protein
VEIEFTVDIEPRTQEGFTLNNEKVPARTVYDIYVRDVNGNLLVFSNQGYENRSFAEELAVRLFSGKPARLNVWSADRDLVVTRDLSE